MLNSAQKEIKNKSAPLGCHRVQKMGLSKGEHLLIVKV